MYWLALIVLGAYLIGAVAFLLLSSRRHVAQIGTRTIVVIGVGAVLLSPVVWSLVSVWHATDMTIPIAGPEPGMTDSEEDVDPRLLAFLTTHRDGTTFLAATLTARVAAPLIVSTGEPVMALGGFKGRDDIVLLPWIQTAIADGRVRFFLLSDSDLTPAGQRQYSADVIASWVRTSCKQVPSAEWQTMPSLSRIAELPDVVYDCADVT
jgi:4-amino-4-deoxy-L-arabinose transferase-like glycosyltransferase